VDKLLTTTRKQSHKQFRDEDTKHETTQTWETLDKDDKKQKINLNFYFSVIILMDNDNYINVCLRENTH